MSNGKKIVLVVIVFLILTIAFTANGLYVHEARVNGALRSYIAQEKQSSSTEVLQDEGSNQELMDATHELSPDDTIIDAHKLADDFYLFRVDTFATGDGQLWLVNAVTHEKKIVSKGVGSNFRLHDIDPVGLLTAEFETGQGGNGAEQGSDEIDYFQPDFFLRTKNDLISSKLEFSNGTSTHVVELAPKDGCQGKKNDAEALVTGILLDGKPFSFETPQKVRCYPNGMYPAFEDPQFIENEMGGANSLTFTLLIKNKIGQSATAEIVNPETESPYNPMIRKVEFSDRVSL